MDRDQKEMSTAQTCTTSLFTQRSSTCSTLSSPMCIMYKQYMRLNQWSWAHILNIIHEMHAIKFYFKMICSYIIYIIH